MQQQGYDINLLRQEAHTRWLKPSEVLFILQNYESFKIDSEPPQKPPSGSLFLFNRRVLRYFRKDGHAWRRKKDGRAVGEAHEKLKVGNADVLSCYYAHGERNPYFQRRSYWMLDPAYEHIVLVHYREVAEGRYTGSILNLSPEPNATTVDQTTNSSNTQSQSLTTGNNEFCEPYHSSCSSSPVEDAISKADDRNESTDGSGKYDSSTRQALRKLAEQLSLEDYDDYIHLENNQPGYPGNLQLSSNVGRYVQDSGAGKQVGYADFQSPDISGNHRMEQSLYFGTSYGFERKESPSWKDMLELSSSSGGSDDYRRTNFLGFNGTPELEAPAKDMNTLLCSAERDEGPTILFDELSVLQNSKDISNGHQLDESELQVQLSAAKKYLLGSDDYNESPSSNSLQVRTHDLMLQGNPRMNWMGSIPLAVENNTYSADFSNSWFDHNQFNSSLGLDSSLTLAQKQRFSISEISPEWAYCCERTKVIIVGKFLCDPSECSWAAMFGDVEVPVEIVQGGVLRCKAPQHSTGKVTLCVTSANRESCSELREFEFREKPATAFPIGTSPSINNAKSAEEQLLLAKFVQLIISQNDSSTIPECMGRLNASDDHWRQLIDALESGCENPLGTDDWIIEELLKDKLFSWLSSKNILSKQEQGIIHLISGLGYEWALNPIINAGVGINFRDANGWTALHWAAHFGRENMVAALLAAGASAGLVTDPTPQDPVGKTPGFIASARGHKGLAGYLSEIALTSHLSSLTIEECEISKVSAEVEADIAVESISQRSAQLHGGTEDELTIRDSLEAVRNATQAAARIQAAFRAHSFRKKREKASQFRDDYGMTQEEVLSAAKLHRSQKFDKAALSIQKNYRGWKGRKDFLTLRKHVVKIQAHVRGHQVRKKYREILRAVSVVEKAVLRWRRRGIGLRGFRNEPEPEMVEVEENEEEEDVAKVFRKQKVDEALEEAVSRVLSVVDSPKARQQYRRVLERYHHAKAESSTPDEATSRLRDDFTIIEGDDFMYSL